MRPFDAKPKLEGLLERCRSDDARCAWATFREFAAVVPRRTFEDIHGHEYSLEGDELDLETFTDSETGPRFVVDLSRTFAMSDADGNPAFHGVTLTLSFPVGSELESLDSEERRVVIDSCVDRSQALERWRRAVESTAAFQATVLRSAPARIVVEAGDW
jgi:hypothetical protein